LAVCRFLGVPFSGGGDGPPYIISLFFIGGSYKYKWNNTHTNADGLQSIDRSVPCSTGTCSVCVCVT
jgi:hypothetical protein